MGSSDYPFDLTPCDFIVGKGSLVEGQNIVLEKLENLAPPPLIRSCRELKILN
jgi:hypothetical protein